MRGVRSVPLWSTGNQARGGGPHRRCVIIFAILTHTFAGIGVLSEICRWGEARVSYEHVKITKSTSIPVSRRDTMDGKA